MKPTLINKKKFQKDEVLKAVPQIHWLFLINPLLKILLLFAAFFLAIFIYPFVPANPLASLDLIHSSIQWVFAGILIIIAVCFVLKVCMYMCTEYGISNRRVFVKKGIVNISVSEMALEKIESIALAQGLAGRLFNYGTIRIKGTGGSVITFQMICKPFAVRRKIGEAAEENRMRPQPVRPIPPARHPLPLGSVSAAAQTQSVAAARPAVPGGVGPV